MVCLPPLAAHDGCGGTYHVAGAEHLEEGEAVGGAHDAALRLCAVSGLVVPRTVGCGVEGGLARPVQRQRPGLVAGTSKTRHAPRPPCEVRAQPQLQLLLHTHGV